MQKMPVDIASISDSVIYLHPTLVEQRVGDFIGSIAVFQIAYTDSRDIIDRSSAQSESNRKVDIIAIKVIFLIWQSMRKKYIPMKEQSSPKTIRDLIELMGIYCMIRAEKLSNEIQEIKTQKIIFRIKRFVCVDVSGKITRNVFSMTHDTEIRIMYVLVFFYVFTSEYHLIQSLLIKDIIIIQQKYMLDIELSMQDMMQSVIHSSSGSFIGVIMEDKEIIRISCKMFRQKSLYIIGTSVIDNNYLANGIVDDRQDRFQQKIFSVSIRNDHYSDVHAAVCGVK